MVVFVALTLVALSTLGWTYPVTSLGYLSLALMLAGGILRISDKDTSGSAGAFTEALRLILSQRWIQVLLLTVIVLRIADGLLSFGIQQHFMASASGQKFQSELSHGIWRLTGPHWPSILGFSTSIIQSISSAAGGFFPRAGIPLGRGATFTALAILCILPSLRRKLEALNVAPERLPDLGLIKKLLVPTALMCILTAVGQPVFIWIQYVFLTYPHTNSIKPILIDLMGLAQLGSAFIWVVLSAALIAGTSGSLLRVEKQEGITSDTFVSDMVRFFKPIAGLYLILFAAEQLLFAPSLWLSFHVTRPGAAQSHLTNLTSTYIFFMLTVQKVLHILLMFAPFLAVAGYRRGRDLFIMGIRQWFSQWRNFWKFIAIGLAVGATIVLPVQLIQKCMGSAISYIRIVPIVIAPFFEVFGCILMLCAVWTFYRRNFLIEEHQHEETTVQV